MRRPPRFLRVPLEPLLDGAAEFTLPESVARYVTRVHRLGEGDRFVAFDPEARSEADAEIIRVGRDVVCRVGERRISEAIARPGVTLLQALGKGDKPDQVIRDATALGAERIVLLESSRAIVRLDGERGETRRRRWRAIAVESARQCGRGDLPEIDGPVPLEDALTHLGEGEYRLCLSPAAAKRLVDALAGFRGDSRIAVLIGPEGGFDAEEEATAVRAGFVLVALSDFVLRTETAAVAALAVIAALRPED